MTRRVVGFAAFLSLGAVTACATTPIAALDADEITQVQSGTHGVIAMTQRSNSEKCWLASFTAMSEARYEELEVIREARRAAEEAGETYEAPEDDKDKEETYLGASITDGKDVAAAVVPPGTYYVEPFACTQIVAYSPVAVTRENLILNADPIFTPVTVKAGEMIWLPMAVITDADYVRDEDMIERYLENNDDKTREDALEPMDGFKFRVVSNPIPDRETLEPYLGMLPTNIRTVDLEIADADETGASKPIPTVGILNALD